jgi:predicted metal-dependent phosphoesterase TrpH
MLQVTHNLIMKFDLHVHTTLSSCSQLTLDDILRHAKAKGLDGVCITDHQTMAADMKVQEGIQKDGLCIIIGMEYTTPDGDFLIFGPLNNLDDNMGAKELLRMVDRSGGVAVAAHPFREGRNTTREIIAQQYCRIIEGKNGRDNGIGQERAADWQAEYNVHLVGGSDAHSLEELGRIGTTFENPVRNKKEFIDALKSGRYQPVSNIS